VRIYRRRVHPNRALHSFPLEAPHGQVRLLTTCSSLNFVLFISKAPILAPGAFQIIPGGDYRGQVMFVVTNDPGIAQIAYSFACAPKPSLFGVESTP
jgi:hypothetical protein